MSRHRHQMRFGTEMPGDGRVRFRLWAPAAEGVALCLPDRGADARLSMTPEAGGWWGLAPTAAGPREAYAFRIDDDLTVPDPAARCQVADVHGPSRVVDPEAFEWTDDDWRGRPWEEVVLYELHVGSFTPEGTFEGVRRHLDELVELGVTAIELMPVGDFPGARNWGYDGVLPFAPDRAYGSPGDLKTLVCDAHARGLMVFLDVIYNHLGPDGNYLPHYAPEFFSRRHRTTWGAALNFDGPGSAWVRHFVVDNALYWLEEYHLDGLRLDAVQAIVDDSRPDIVEELADAVRRRFEGRRRVHLVLENLDNEARYLARDAAGRPVRHDAQWNDDLHHALHVLLTGEADGYYRDYAERPLAHLGRCLAEGFAYQGELSIHHDGPRGEPSAHLPPTAFVGFLQNHDQVGNRACGERITGLAAPEAVRAAIAIVLLAPQPPLLFMGQEWGSRRPFQFFCDFGPELAPKVAKGRRDEFAAFAHFRDPEVRRRIPDPNDPATFHRSVLDRDEADTEEGRAWLALHRDLLALRRREIVPRLAGIRGGAGEWQELAPRALRASWRLGDASRLTLLANLGDTAAEGIPAPTGALLHGTDDGAAGRLMPWSVAWYLDEHAS